VNKIDTCLYVSPFIPVSLGNNNFTWDGKDENGTQVPPGSYTYYVWAVDTVNKRDLVTSGASFFWWTYQTVITHNPNGFPLDKPIVYNEHFSFDLYQCADSDPRDILNIKWVIGNDPADASLRETTISKGWGSNSGLAFQPDNYKYYFHDTLKAITQTKITRKWEWVPNGVSILQTAWGDNGQFSYSGRWGSTTHGPGVVSDGKDYLFMVKAAITDTIPCSELIYVDVKTGKEVKRLDLSSWWVSESDYKAGGQMNGGPLSVNFRDGYLFLGAHSTCLNQMISPYEDAAEAVKWSNGNGDYTGDHNYSPSSARKWVCNDFNTGPFKYDLRADSNHFSAFPAFETGSMQTFGLYAPDGTGMGYIAVAEEDGKAKFGVELLDYGSAYDGLYNNGIFLNVADAWHNNYNIWFTGSDSIKGTISNVTGVADELPAQFMVSQNSPNPFNPSTTISFTLAKAGKTTVEVYNMAGQKVVSILDANLSAGSHSVTWDATNFAAGVYFYTVRSGKFLGTRKMTLLK